jgi:peptidoglycan hydrolase-like protein with peptidoglycan-binding domain
MASKAKPVQAKSDPVIEALQRELKQQGFYAGDIDGQAGEKTTNAVAAREAAKQRDRQLEIDLINAQGGKTTADATAAASAVETARKQRYEGEASSGVGMATQSGANLAAPAAGTALGMALGRGVNAGMDRAQESRNTVLRGAADDRMAGRTTVEGAREGVRRAGAMPPSTGAGRVMSRMLPQAGLGALSLGKGAQVLSQSDPNAEFYPAMADRAAGLGYIGAGAGLAKQGMRYAAAPGVAPDAQALAIINSNQLRRNGPQGPLSKALAGEVIDAPMDGAKPAIAAPEAPVKPTAAPGTKAHMQAQAKDLGLKGVSKLSKSELATKLAEAMAEHGGKRTVAKRVPKLPSGSGAAGIAAALAYAATPDRAEAGGGQASVGRYITSRLAPGADTMARAGDVYDDYVKYAAAIGQTPIPQVAFARQMREGGVGMARMAGDNRYMAGIKPGDYEGPSGGGQAEALTNAGVAGGAAYGVSKLAQALGPVARGVIAGTGEAMTPLAITSASDAFNLTPDELDADAHKAAQVMPSWARSAYSAVGFPEVENAYQMAQAPARSDNAELAQAQRMQAERMPMASAQSLQIPEGIQAPREDGSDPFAGSQEAAAPQGFGGNIQARLDRMIRLGAPPEAISQFLNSAVR